MKNKENIPVIKILEIIEHKDGSATYKFSYGEDFIEQVREFYKLNKKPTKKQISKYILDAVKEYVEDKEK